MSDQLPRASHPSLMRNARVGSVVIAAAIAAVLVLVVVTNAARPARPRAEVSPGHPAASPVLRGEFAVLSAADTDVCQDMGNLQAVESYISALPDPARMQGSCCSPMDQQRFTEQVKALGAYAAIPEIPSDPYDISKSQAEELLGFYNTAPLDQAQQHVYDLAQSETSDHGWCCCQCWAWYAHAGLAKYVIAQQGFDAQQAAKLIDLEDCCGGS